MNDTDWMKEFDFPAIPHADVFVHSIKREKELKSINIVYNNQHETLINPKTKTVSFNDTIVVHYFDITQ